MAQFYEGFMEAKQLEADVRNKEALAQERIMTAKAQAQKLARETAELDVMRQVFGSTPQAAQAISEDDPKYINQLEMAGRALMKVNPVSGMTMLGKANALKRSTLEARKLQLKEQEGEATNIGAGLSAVTDQESYDVFMADLEARGKPIPRGLTGDYSRDKNLITFHTNRAMTAKDQTNAAYKAVSAEVKLSDLTRKAEGAQLRAEVEKSKLELAQERLAQARKQHEDRMRNADRDMARKEKGVEAKPVTKMDREAAEAVIGANENIHLGPMATRTVAETLAARAKKRAKGDPEAYQDYLYEELETMLELGELKAPKKELMNPSTWFTKPEFKPRGDRNEGRRKGDTLPEEAVSKLKEGVTTTFRNGQRWTLRDGKPVQV